MVSIYRHIPICQSALGSQSANELISKNFSVPETISNLGFQSPIIPLTFAVMKILMVCLGNICRSPLADGLLRRKVAEGNLDVLVDSAGTSGYHEGEGPDKRMIETSKRRGTEIGFLRSRPFSAADFETFDVIYVMDRSNLQNVLKLAKNDAEKVKVKLILNEVNPEAHDEVPDPYFGGSEGFEHVYDLLDQATDNIIGKIKNNVL